MAPLFALLEMVINMNNIYGYISSLYYHAKRMINYYNT